eukprot:m51a1_g12978 hypothetical protein (223) ;mRNA; r:203-2750
MKTGSHTVRSVSECSGQGSCTSEVRDGSDRREGWTKRRRISLQRAIPCAIGTITAVVLVLSITPVAVLWAATSDDLVRSALSSIEEQALMSRSNMVARAITNISAQLMQPVTAAGILSLQIPGEMLNRSVAPYIEFLSLLYAFRCLGCVPIRGFTMPITVHEFLGLTSELSPENRSIYENFAEVGDLLSRGQCTLERLKEYVTDHPEDLAAPRILANFASSE